MSCHFIDMVCGWEDLAVIVVVSCIMVCQEREMGQGEKLFQDEAVRVTMLPLVSLLFSCFIFHCSLLISSQYQCSDGPAELGGVAGSWLGEEDP